MKSATQSPPKTPVRTQVAGQLRRIHALRPIACCVMLAFCETSLANPGGPAVAAGAATFNASGNTLSVTNAPGTIINWKSFSIGSAEHTRFLQQSASSTVLNRVVGAEASSILGALSSNGRVFLVNPHGVVFGAGARIDTAGFIASTLNITDSDFLQGKLRFQGGGLGVLRNEGIIRASGDIMLVGPAIENAGIIRSDNGSVLLAAGKSVTITSPDAQGVKFELQAPTDSALNVGTIEAANAASMFAGTLRHSGEIRATSAAVHAGGRVVLSAQKEAVVESGAIVTASGTHGGSVTIQSGDVTSVAGRIEAMGTSGAGGAVHILGEHVAVNSGASIDASGETGGGSILVGGDYRGANADVQNAWKTVVASGVTLRANAGSSGDGGKVVVWADGATRYEGEISARGGMQTGDGGMVEVSGKKFLDFRGDVDTRAPHGKVGTLLLDPTTYNIVATNSATSDTELTGNRFDETGAVPPVSEITVARLHTALQSSDVIISTESSGAGAGDINFNAPFDLNGIGGSKRLTLLADRDVNIANPIFDSVADMESLTLVLITGGATNISASVALGETGVIDASRDGSRIVNLNAGAPVIPSAIKAGTLNVNGAAASIGGRITADVVNISSGSLDMTGVTPDLPRVDMSGGTLTNSTAGGNLTIKGPFNVTGGTILQGGGGELFTEGTTTVGTALLPSTLSTTRNWTNFGVLNLDAGLINVAGGTTFTNGGSGTLNLNSTDQSPFGTSGLASIVNSGTFNKNSAGLSDFANPFTNSSSGIVNVNAGTLRAPLGVTQLGTIELAANAVFSTGDTDMTNGVGAVIGGTGTLDVGTKTLTNEGILRPGAPARADGTDSADSNALTTSVGTLTIQGNLQVGGVNSSIDIELRGPGSGEFDVLNVTGEARLNGGGGVAVSTPGEYMPFGGELLVVLTGGAVTSDFSTGVTASFSNGATRMLTLPNVTLAIGSPLVRTWDVAAAPLGGAFDNPMNWIGNVAPTGNEQIIIPDLPGTPLITFANGGTFTADLLHSAETVVVAGGTTLILRNASTIAGVLRLQDGSTIGGPGRLVITHPTDGLRISGGTVASTRGVVVGFTTIEPGAAFITGRLTTNGLNMAAGPLTVQGGGVLNLQGGGLKSIGAGTVLTVAGGGLLTLAGSDLLVNAALVNNGRIEVPGAFAILGDNQPSAFVNTGTIAKTEAGILTIGSGSLLTFTNTGGTLDAQSGSIRFGGNSIFTAGTRFTGAGTNVIAAGAPGLVTVLDGAIASSNLILEVGTFVGNATLAGTVGWTGGTIVSPYTIAEGATLNVTGNAPKAIDGAAGFLANNGTVNVSGTGNALTGGAGFDNFGNLNFTGDGLIALGDSSTLRNAPTGIVNFGSSAAFVVAGTGTSSLLNQGMLNKTAGAAATQTLDTPFSNSGAVALRSGNLMLTQGGTDTGDYDLLADTTLEMGGGSRVFENGTSFFGDGTLRLSGGSLTVNNDGLPGLDLVEGTLGRTALGALTVAGPFNISGGFIAPNPGDVTGPLVTEGTTTITGLIGTSRNWINKGVVNLNGTAGRISPTSGSALRFENEGTVNINTTDPTPFSNAGDSTIVNRGTIVKTSTGVSDFANPFVNETTGTLEVVNGTVRLPSTITQGGTIIVDSAGTLNTAGQNLANPALAAIRGSGTLDLGGATLINNGTLAPRRTGSFFGDGTLDILGNLSLISATVTGPGAVTVSGTTGVSGGTSSLTASLTTGTFVMSSGGLDIGAAGVLNLNGAGEKTINGTLTNRGAVNLSGTSDATLGAGALWDNAGETNIGGSSRIVLGGAGGTATTLVNRTAGTITDTSSSAAPVTTGTTTRANKSFINAGRFVKAAGSAAVQTLDVPMTNTGTVRVASGTLVANGFPSNSGVIDLAAGTTFSTGGGALTNTALGLLKGKGTLLAPTFTNNGLVSPGDSPGVLTVSGNYVQGPGGTLLVELGGTAAGTDYDQLKVTGNAALDGTLLVIPSSSPIVPGTAYEVVTYGSRTGDFSSFSTPTGSTFVVTPGPTSYRLDAPLPFTSNDTTIRELVAITQKDAFVLSERTFGTAQQILNSKDPEEEKKLPVEECR